jgi:hypothetical protein
MTPVEKLQAAIDKLTMLKEQSTPRWARSHDYTAPGELALCFHDLLDADAELVLTLHRTIDAQLAILRDAVEFGKTFGYGESGSRSSQIDHWFELADALLWPAHE